MECNSIWPTCIWIFIHLAWNVKWKWLSTLYLHKLTAKAYNYVWVQVFAPINIYCKYWVPIAIICGLYVIKYSQNYMYWLLFYKICDRNKHPGFFVAVSTRHFGFTVSRSFSQFMQITCISLNKISCPSLDLVPCVCYSGLLNIKKFFIWSHHSWKIKHPDHKI